MSKLGLAGQHQTAHNYIDAGAGLGFLRLNFLRKCPQIPSRCLAIACASEPLFFAIQGWAKICLYFLDINYIYSRLQMLEFLKNSRHCD